MNNPIFQVNQLLIAATGAYFKGSELTATHSDERKAQLKKRTDQEVRKKHLPGAAEKLDEAQKHSGFLA